MSSISRIQLGDGQIFDIEDVSAQTQLIAHVQRLLAIENKLATIDEGAQVNQKAFTIVKVGSTQIRADNEQDIIELVADGKITITPDDTNDKVIISSTWRGIQDNLTSDSATDSLSAKQGKALKTLVDGKADKSASITNITRSGTTFTATRADGTTFTFNQQDNNTTYSSLAAASGGTAVSLVTTGEKYNWNSKPGTAVATTSANGLMSSSDKTKLNNLPNKITVSTSAPSGGSNGDIWFTV